MTSDALLRLAVQFMIALSLFSGGIAMVGPFEPS